jgi:hypothetical protein
MDDQEQRDDALAKLKQFRADASGEKDPIAGQIAREMEEQRRSKARNKLIGAGKVRISSFYRNHHKIVMLYRA